MLGVTPSVSDEALRRAYLAAARTAHPDVAGPDGELRMRAINAAWAVLRDERRREAYDLSLSDVGRASGPTLNNPVRKPFVPIYAEDEDDDDSWRFEDDVTDPLTATGPALQFIPLLLVIVGVVCAVMGWLLTLDAIKKFGIVVAIIGLVGFLAAPLIAMGRAKSVEARRDAQAR